MSKATLVTRTPVRMPDMWGNGPAGCWNDKTPYRREGKGRSDVKQRAQCPCLRPDQSSFRLQAAVMRRRRKRRQERHLHLIQSRRPGELEHGVEQLMRITVQTQDEVDLLDLPNLGATPTLPGSEA